MSENLVNSLVSLSSKASLEFIKDTSQGVINTLGNVLGVNNFNLYSSKII